MKIDNTKRLLKDCIEEYLGEYSSDNIYQFQNTSNKNFYLYYGEGENVLPVIIIPKLDIFHKWIEGDIPVYVYLPERGEIHIPVIKIEDR